MARVFVIFSGLTPLDIVIDCKGWIEAGCFDENIVERLEGRCCFLCLYVKLVVPRRALPAGERLGGERLGGEHLGGEHLGGLVARYLSFKYALRTTTTHAVYVKQCVLWYWHCIALV